jgi:AraC-like DNA-binding protein
MTGSGNNFRTNGVREAERFSFWSDAVCDTYVQLGCEYDGNKPFEGSLAVREYETIAFSKVQASHHKVIRRPYDISRSDQNDFLLSIQLEKSSHLSQRNNSSRLDPFDFAIYDSTEPYELELSDHFQMIVLQFPKKKLVDRLPNAEMLVGRKVSSTSELGKFASENILQISEMIDAQPGPGQILLQETILDLVASSLATIEGDLYELSIPEQRILLRAKTFILSHLCDLNLNLEAVAASTGMSVRRLSEIFASNGITIAGFIREARLNRVASELRDERFARQTISEIALRNGFNNIQHFSTLFHKHFGCTPTEHKTMGQHIQKIRPN